MQIKTHFAQQASPELFESQLRFRIDLTRQRAHNYPMDSLEFVCIDLEQPYGHVRHAHLCNGDLTGRYLDYLSASEAIEPSSDGARLDALFARILSSQNENGLVGRMWGGEEKVKNNAAGAIGAGGAFSKVINGLLRYYLLRGDYSALNAAKRIAEYVFRHMGDLRELCGGIKAKYGNSLEFWLTEPMAMLYGITGDERCLEAARIAGDSLVKMEGAHSHGFMTTLRGLQLMALYTGDLSWNEKPEHYRARIAKEALLPDGCIPEAFPFSRRNEGCSIADWIMLNLYAGLITGSDEAYEKAEHSLYNALYFNQAVNGGFGHCDLTPFGYRAGTLSEEAWWCCLHDCGLSLIEYARHAVTLRDGVIRINLLVPGRFTLKKPDGGEIEVVVHTDYPASPSTVIAVSGSDSPVYVRVPPCIKNAAVTEKASNGGRTFTLSGNIGYTAQETDRGVMLLYGPLVLAPLIYDIFDEYLAFDPDATTVPKDYIPPSLPAEQAAIAMPPQDEHGFYKFTKKPDEVWVYFEEGPNSRCGSENVAVDVTLVFENGKHHVTRFFPLCYSTSVSTGYSVPILFKKSINGLKDMTVLQ